MATDFWVSSHYKRWIVDSATIQQARSLDLQYASEEQLALLGIFFANMISKLGKKLQLRQRAIATATVFFRRFYLKNSLCETDPFLVVAACCYVASKAEETPVHVKTALAEARTVFGTDEYGIKHFPSENSKLAEMEFYLVDDLECDLVVFHPYRTLLALVGKEVGTIVTNAEGGEPGVGVNDGKRYWGTGEGRMALHDSCVQMAWFVINDSYRSDLCLIHPPHLIAIAALYLALAFHKKTRDHVFTHGGAQRQQRSGKNKDTNTFKKEEDPINFLAGMNVSIPLVVSIVQDLIGLYALWSKVKDDQSAESAHASSSGSRKKDKARDLRDAAANAGAEEEITTLSLTNLVLRMRERRDQDMSHPASGRPVAINKVLERAQASS